MVECNGAVVFSGGEGEGELWGSKSHGICEMTPPGALPIVPC